MSLEDGLREVDAIFDRFAGLTPSPAPGLVYGTVAAGRLAHVRGIGTLRDGEDAPPGADSAFRIASLTKSFTAAAVLLLRDEGRLGLDDPVATWVPDLGELRGPTADSPPITIRHLLTMAAGLPTDDPWGDRQQGLDLDAFAALLRGGLTFAWAPGTRFEYSNLGYGILGRVVTTVAGAEYRDIVRDRLLAPLGMASTGFDRAEIPPERLAHGHVRRDDAWHAEPIDGYGALAAMGGLFTTIGDLARWVIGFLDAFPPRDDPDDGHPLRRATRREMQDAQQTFPPELSVPTVDAPAELLAGGYGFGLDVFDDLRLGRVVGHSGGYPGFGSHMRWHPASGLGVVAFGNARYTPLTRPTREALAALVLSEAAPIRRVARAPATEAARDAVERLLAGWDDDVASRLFAMNVDLDEPLERRRAAIVRLREAHGTLTRDESVTPESDGPLHLAWWLSGERGRVRVEIGLTPELPPRVQTLELRSVPEPPAALAALARRIVEALGTPEPAWPADVPLAPAVDRPAVERALRAAEALFGPLRLDRPTAGDGERTATWRLTSERGTLDLRLAVDPADGSPTEVAFVPETRIPPVYAV
jgi:CubicO group peptidase (beta-lactamase class C family)